MTELTIAGLARAGMVGVETVRYYQRRGLLPTPQQQRGSSRRYGDEDVRRLRFIRSSQSAGFTLAEISELLALMVSDDRVRVRVLANERIRVLETKIAELESARDALRRLTDQCSATASGPCPILAAFDKG